MDTFAGGRYRVVSELARGRFATVYKAHDVTGGHDVALKILSLDGTHRDLARAMFHKEVAALESVTHARIVRMLGSFEEKERPALALVLELVRGDNLENVIRTTPQASRPSIRWRLHELVALAGALEAAHRENVVHRDIKPSNVLFDSESNELRLADFGIARLLENYGRGTAVATLAQFYSRPYAAPEQVLHGDATAASDLHAFGLLAAAVLAWQLPPEEFRQDDVSAFLQPVQRDIRDSKLVEGLTSLIRSLLGSEPRLRPRMPAVMRVLADAAERTVERQRIALTLSAAAKRKLGELMDVGAALDDMSDGLRARYELPRDEQSSFSILCWGRSLRMRLVPASDQKLLVIDVVALEPSQHARERERAASVPFALGATGAPYDALVDILFAAHRKAEKEEAARRKREDLVELARTMVTMQLEQLPTSLLRYRIVDDRPTARLTDHLRFRLTGTSAPAAAPADKVVALTTEFVRVEIIGVVDDEASEEQRAAMLTTWHQTLSSDATVTAAGVRLGVAHGYDAGTRVLTVRRDASSIPREDVLEIFDLRSKAALDRLDKALRIFAEGTSANSRLGDLLVFPEKNHLDDLVPRELTQELEPAELVRELVSRILAARDFFVLQGPPGTGKTTVISEVVTQILSENPNAKILLTSQSNEAVDHAIQGTRLLASKLLRDWRLFRDSRGGRVERNEAPPEDVDFNDWLERTKASSVSALAELTPSLPPENVDNIRQVIAKWRDQLDRAPDVRADFLNSVQVFGATCLRVPAIAKDLRQTSFDWVIIDEAARATPAEVMVALVRGQRFVLVGDQKQLPPYLARETEQGLIEQGIDPALAKRSLFQDLFEKIPDRNRASLRRQFRMHRSIARIIGDLFYEEIAGLETGVADERREVALTAFAGDHRIFWRDVRGTEERDGTSWYNEREISTVLAELEAMQAELEPQGVTYDVAVIAAYVAQARRIERALRSRVPKLTQLRVRVATVDAFQGKEADVVVYSLVRVGEEEKRFLADPHRLNVAFSRAKRLVLVVGDVETACRSRLFSRLVQSIPAGNLKKVEDAS